MIFQWFLKYGIEKVSSNLIITATTDLETKRRRLDETRTVIYYEYREHILTDILNKFLGQIPFCTI
jgi:hypothetical protein